MKFDKLIKLIESDSKKTITTYHITSYENYLMMKKKKKIGLTSEDWVDIIEPIVDQFDIPDKDVQKYIKDLKSKIEDYAPNGQVSLWQDFDEKDEYHSKWITKRHGESGRIPRIEQTLKWIARKTKKSYQKLKKEYLPKEASKMVVLTIELPLNMIANKNAIKKKPNDVGYELYTNRSIPIKYVKDIQVINF